MVADIVPPIRFFGNDDFHVMPYRSGAFQLFKEQGERAVFGVILINKGLETGSYEIELSSEHGWSIQGPTGFTLEPGHHQVFQFTVDVPLDAEIGIREHIQLVVRSVGNDHLGEGESFYILVSDIPLTDSDGDNLIDSREQLLGLNPNNPDTDGDGIFDGVEIVHPLSPEDVDQDGIIDANDPDNISPLDSDNDGVGDDREVALGLDPNNPDTDGDGINDGLEVGTPRIDDPPIDYDGDGYIDALESGDGAYNENESPPICNCEEVYYSCTIEGSAGPDTIMGTNKADVICGFGGSDIIMGQNGNDIICGGPAMITSKVVTVRIVLVVMTVKTY